MLTPENNVDKFVHDEKRSTEFIDGKHLGELLSRTAKKAREAKKDLRKTENWTPEMIEFYNFLMTRCKKAADAGKTYYIIDATSLSKDFDFVFDYLRDHCGVIYVRETYRGFNSVEDGVYVRLCW